MTRPNCIITGCCLLVDHRRWNGDLFELGDAYIFNANPHSEQDADKDAYYSKELVINDGADFFERRAVFVIHKAAATLNAEALAYIDGAP